MTNDTIETIVVDPENFEREVLQSDVPVLVDLWAAWCGPCRALAPIIDALAQEVAGTAKVAKLDVDANQALAASFGVTSIPTLLYFKDGKEVARQVGGAALPALAQKLRELAGEDA